MEASFTQAETAQISPLMIADRLLTLAKDADRAGLRRPAQRLLQLAFAVYDEKPGHA